MVNRKHNIKGLFDPTKVQVCRLEKGELRCVYADVKDGNAEHIELVVDGMSLNSNAFHRQGWTVCGGVGSTMYKLQKDKFSSIEIPDERNDNERVGKPKKPRPKLFKTSPYFDKTDKPILRESCCVFADVLGFKQLVANAKTANKSQQLLEEIFAALQSSGRELQDNKQWRSYPPLWDYKFFTDNLVLGYPRLERSQWEDAESEFGRTFGLISNHQLTLALHGFFLRGGLCFGELHISSQLVFGQALLDAYQIESERARVPRIMFHDSAVEKVCQQLMSYAKVEVSPHQADILIDSDGALFINYLNSLIFDDAVYEEGLQTHKEQVVNKLKESKGTAVEDKYVWLAQYHNFFCDEFLTNAEKYKLEIPDRAFRHLGSGFVKQEDGIIKDIRTT